MHTQGPWTYRDNAVWLEMDAPSPPIATVFLDHRSDAERHANGVLIAAAPDLRDVLSDLVAYIWARQEIRRQFDLSGHAMLEAARHALAKARETAG